MNGFCATLGADYHTIVNVLIRILYSFAFVVFYIQTLRCSVDPAKYNINKIVCNHYGSHVALIGSMGASILELPIRRGKFGMFEDGKDVIRCRYIQCSKCLISMIYADSLSGS